VKPVTRRFRVKTQSRCPSCKHSVVDVVLVKKDYHFTCCQCNHEWENGPLNFKIVNHQENGRFLGFFWGDWIEDEAKVVKAWFSAYIYKVGVSVEWNLYKGRCIYSAWELSSNKVVVAPSLSEMICKVSYQCHAKL
jgi:hypothetical protein